MRVFWSSKSSRLFDSGAIARYREHRRRDIPRRSFGQPLEAIALAAGYRDADQPVAELFDGLVANGSGSLKR
jgi:hypothetical protein